MVRTRNFQFLNRGSIPLLSTLAYFCGVYVLLYNDEVQQRLCEVIDVISITFFKKTTHGAIG